MRSVLHNRNPWYKIGQKKKGGCVWETPYFFSCFCFCYLSSKTTFKLHQRHIQPYRENKENANRLQEHLKLLYDAKSLSTGAYIVDTIVCVIMRHAGNPQTEDKSKTRKQNAKNMKRRATMLNPSGHPKFLNLRNTENLKSSLTQVMPRDNVRWQVQGMGLVWQPSG